MRPRLLTSCVLLFSLSGWLCAQSAGQSGASLADRGVLPAFSYSDSNLNTPLLPAPAAGDNASLSSTIAVALPRMAPELALQAYHGRTVVQAAQLGSYSALTVVRAELPDTKQSGEYELQRHFSAPHHLVFKPVQFTGDNFVRNNVILRVLQSEVDHQKDDPALNAITPANYKFSYKGTTELGDRVVHVYQIKPRHKRAGLFKGRIYLDVFSGSMVRAEGKLIKSPSLFVKKVSFVQDYADVGPFTFPVHIHSEAQARIVGRAIVDIYDSDYQPVSSVAQAKSSPAM
jgi:hypothetical protein